MAIRTIILLLLTAASSFSVLIPTDYITDWTANVRTGVIGGIPTTRTQSGATIATTGNTTDRTSVIQAAINAAPANTYVLIGPGVFYYSGTINLKNGTTLRGSGDPATILRRTGGGSYGIFAGFGNDYGWGNFQTVTAGNTRDSTTVTVPSTGAFTVGFIARLQWSNQVSDAALTSGGTIVMSTYGTSNYQVGRGDRKQKVFITGKTATTITFTPGIHHTPQAGLACTIAPSTGVGEGIGLEDMRVEFPSSAPIFGVTYQECHNCWIKNVTSIGAANYPFFFWDTMQSEIRHSTGIGDGVATSNKAAFLINGSNSNLIEDNIAALSFPALEMNEGSSGNVFAYNYLKGTVDIFATMNVNHNPHNSHNLFEGNVGPSMQSDGYFGSASELTFFRNWFTTTNITESYYTFCMSLNRWTRNCAMIGNLMGIAGAPSSNFYSFGNPNIGNSTFIGTCKISAGQFPVDWKMTGQLLSGGGTSSGTLRFDSGTMHSGAFRSFLFWNGQQEWMALANPVVSGNQVSFSAGDVLTTNILPPNGTALFISPGTEGFQERDLDCDPTYAGGTTILKANYNMKLGNIPANEPLGGDVMPASLFRSSKPAYFGNLAWPPFDSQNVGVKTTSQRYQSIPAVYRDVNGSDPVGGADTTPPTVAIPVIDLTGTILQVPFSEAVQNGVGGSGGWTINASGGAATIAFSSGAGSSVYLFNIGGRVINSGETVSISYIQPGNGVQDLAVPPNNLATVSNIPVTNGSAQGSLVPPQIVLPAGPYYGSQLTTINEATSGAAIHYTTDGSTPTVSSATYTTTPITINTGLTLRAIATKSGFPDSSISQSVYEVNSWLSGPAIKNVAFPAVPATFNVTFRVTPSNTNSNTVVSLCPFPASSSSDLACTVWFTDTGFIQARNGGAYSAVNVMPHAGGTPYIVAITGSLATHTYSMTVTPQGGATTVIATNYAFRTEQAAATQLANLSMFTATGTATVDSLSFVAGTSSGRYIGLRNVTNAP